MNKFRLGFNCISLSRVCVRWRFRYGSQNSVWAEPGHNFHILWSLFPAAAAILSFCPDLFRWWVSARTCGYSQTLSSPRLIRLDLFCKIVFAGMVISEIRTAKQISRSFHYTKFGIGFGIYSTRTCKCAAFHSANLFLLKKHLGRIYSMKVSKSAFTMKKWF